MGAWGSTFPISGHANNDEYITGNAAVAARAIYIGGRTGGSMMLLRIIVMLVQCPYGLKTTSKLQPIRPDNRHELIPIGQSSLIWGAGMNAEADCMDNFAWGFVAAALVL